jgi:hypothetical protein
MNDKCLICQLRFINLLEKIQKHICNTLGLDDMHISLSSLKYRPHSLMLHHHIVYLFVIQILLSFYDALAQLSLPYVNPQLKCKCSAHHGLSATITSLIVY